MTDSRGVQVLVGTDITRIDKIATLSETALKRIFTKHELADSRVEHLAGIFAAKEAFFKAFGQKPKWQLIEIKKHKTGQPFIIVDSQYTTYKSNCSTISLSISHDGDYAIATVAIILNK